MRTGRRPIRAIAAALAAIGLIALSAPTVHARGRTLTSAAAERILASLHPDHSRWIGGIRLGDAGAEAGIYAGLVRPGGRDPRDPRDAPVAGDGVVNDLVIFPHAFESRSSPSWIALVIDHEYFHARHLARGFPVPLVSFEGRADRDYLEALAWGWVLGRAAQGRYGALTASERSEVAARYRRHRDAFRRFVMDVQPTAWAHYGRFLREAEAGPRPVTSVASAP